MVLEGSNIEMEEMRTQKTIIQTACLLLMVMMIGSSCQDSKIAEEMVGTWKGNHVVSYDDGTKSYQEEIVTYKRNDGKDDGGTFTEVSTGKEEIDDDEVNVKYKWISRIEGTWEIKEGNLYQHYNLSTLEVEIGDDDIDYNFNNVNLFLTDFDVLFAQGMYLSQNLQKDLKKDTYKTLFRYYKNQNIQDKDGAGFLNVEVNGDMLSYETIDGRVNYVRVEMNQPETRDDMGTDGQAYQQSDDANDDSFFCQQVDKWNDMHHQHGFEDSSNNPYAETVMYYGKRITGKEVVKMKQDFLSKSPDYRQECYNITVIKLTDNRVRCDFGKRVTINGKTKEYPSYLYFTKELGKNWLIDEESDEITNRNLRK